MTLETSARGQAGVGEEAERVEIWRWHSRRRCWRRGSGNHDFRAMTWMMAGVGAGCWQCCPEKGGQEGDWLAAEQWAPFPRQLAFYLHPSHLSGCAISVNMLGVLSILSPTSHWATQLVHITKAWSMYSDVITQDEVSFGHYRRVQPDSCIWVSVLPGWPGVSDITPKGLSFVLWKLGTVRESPSLRCQRGERVGSCQELPAVPDSWRCSAGLEVAVSVLVNARGLPQWLWQSGICLQCARPEFDPWVRKTPWRREWKPTPVFLPGKSHGQRNLAGYNPWGRQRVGDHLVTKQTKPVKKLLRSYCNSNTQIPLNRTKAFKSFKHRGKKIEFMV